MEGSVVVPHWRQEGKRAGDCVLELDRELSSDERHGVGVGGVDPGQLWLPFGGREEHEAVPGDGAEVETETKVPSKGLSVKLQEAFAVETR